MIIERSKLGGSDRFTVNGEIEVEVVVDTMGYVFVIDAFDGDGDPIDLSKLNVVEIENAIEVFLSND